MLDALTGLFDELGLDRPHVAGNSLGGRLALEAGVVGRASTVTALSPAGFWRGRGEMLYGWGVFKIMEATGAWTRPLAPVLARSLTGRAVVFSAIVSRPGRLSPEQALGDITSFVAAREAINLILTEIHNFTGQVPEGVPVTVGWGSRDRLLFPRQARLVKAQLPDARLVRLPGCGHVPMTDDPALVADVLLRGSARA
jgi:pimeloyl-ACP methyl ester carboxylesterase